MLTVITGPPCSGKSTYLRQHAKPDDIRIDFDDIAQALGSPVRHGHSEAIGRIAVDTRNAAIASAIAWHHRGTRVWVIDTAPYPGRIAQYDEAGARWVRLTADPDELHRRADEGRPHQWHARIDQWLATSGAEVPAMRRPSSRNPSPSPRTRW